MAVGLSASEVTEAVHSKANQPRWCNARVKQRAARHAMEGKLPGALCRVSALQEQLALADHFDKEVGIIISDTKRAHSLLAQRTGQSHCTHSADHTVRVAVAQGLVSKALGARREAIARECQRSTTQHSCIEAEGVVHSQHGLTARFFFLWWWSFARFLMRFSFACSLWS